MNLNSWVVEFAVREHRAREKRAAELAERGKEEAVDLRQTIYLQELERREAQRRARIAAVDPERDWAYDEHVWAWRFSPVLWVSRVVRGIVVAVVQIRSRRAPRGLARKELQYPS